MRHVFSAFCFATALLGSGLTRPASAQVINGDFSAGNTGFSSDYTLVTASFTLPLEYAVISNPATAFTNGFASFGDHTTGNGLMLFGDGSGNSSDRLWYESVTVTPFTTYTFTAYAAAATSFSPPTFNFYNGASLLGSLGITAAPGVFQQFSATLTTGNVSSIVLAIRDGNTVVYGNDFVVDDISLTRVTAVPEPSSVALLATSTFTIASLLVRRRKQARKTA